MNEIDMRSILKCVRCGTCRSVCPVFDVLGWESSGARGRMLVAHGISQGLEVDEAVLDSLNTCTTCGMCKEMCPSGASPTTVVEQTRHQLVLQGKMTEAQKELRINALEKGNPLGEPKDRMAWLGDSRKDAADKAEYVYFAGCLSSYRFPEVAKRTFDILKNYGVTVLKDEVCCSSPLLRTGSDPSELMSKNLEQIKEVGAHTIITGCAGCYSTLKKDYPEELNVVHVSQFLSDRLEELDLRKLDLKVAYHDPCHLGRCSGVFDAPRELIKAVCELEELENIREKSKCCGAGGGVLKGYPDLALEISKKRVEEVPEDVDYLVTVCPLCRTNLQRGSEKVKVIDVLDLLEMSMG
ncbi:heterodisulfide reductase-related iron-sulfur binding cluster [Methanolobus sp. ZRKC3]|uniref:(Fe-S)-binding protein n=1 Tax=Methanolobus sp. ZRKC3 TaxID=3125786 RepID=UPI0032460C68